MTLEPEQFQRVESLFHEARQLEPAARADMLDRECGDDLDLRAEVESLLAHVRKGLSPTQVLLRRDDATLVERGPVSEGPGARIGPYKILQQIGEGGFGVVYMAEQTKPVQRKVALKIIKLGMDTRQVIARFEAERQALALMDHPNISKVLDAGATETGRPYFVMELVKGISLSEYCNKTKLPMRERLALFLEICHAVQHAHHKGIIHRDLKPSNVLITLHDMKPVPKVIDFGIAKATSRQLTEKTLFTEFRNFIGTPEYMSPDQAEISGLDVDTRTDVYSLGVILYELLTGTTPFDAETLRSAGYGEIQRIILEDEPPKPSTRMDAITTTGGGDEVARLRQAEAGTLSRNLRGDLDWIVMKAMEKDRTRRYQTASDFAADVERFLNDLPVLAGPPSVIYKVRKFVRRHRLGVTAAGLIVAALVTGASMATVGFVQKRQEARRSQQIADFLQSMFVITNPEGAVASGIDVDHVLDTARDVFGNDHATVGAVLSSRALQLQSSGDLDAAEQMYREALDLWVSRYGPDHFNVGKVHGDMGELLMTMGDEVGAEAALRESLRISQAQPGPESVQQCESMAVLAMILVNQGKIDEAISLIKEALRLRIERAPHDKFKIAMTYLGLTNILAVAGRIDEALEYADSTIQACREAFAADSTLLSRVLMDFGAIRYSRDDLEGAEPLLLEADSILADSEVDTASFRMITTRLLFRLYQRQANLEEAVRMAIAGVDVAVQVGDTNVIDDILEDLAELAWEIAADPDRPETEYQHALEAIDRALEQDPDASDAHTIRGALQYRLGEYATSLVTLEIAAAYHADETRPGSPTDLAFMAMAHHQLGHAEEARAMLAQLRAAPEHPRNALSRNNGAPLAEAEALVGAEASVEAGDAG